MRASGRHSEGRLLLSRPGACTSAVMDDDWARHLIIRLQP
jgi:hypothetical protein